MTEELPLPENARDWAKGVAVARAAGTPEYVIEALDSLAAGCGFSLKHLTTAPRTVEELEAAESAMVTLARNTLERLCGLDLT